MKDIKCFFPYSCRLMFAIDMYIPGNDEKSKLVRRALMRRCMSMFILLLRSVSTAINRRFHDLNELVQFGTFSICVKILIRKIKDNELMIFFFVSFFFAILRIGVMTKSELQYFEAIHSDVHLFWVPGSWFVAALQQATENGLLVDPQGTKLIMEVQIRAHATILKKFKNQGKKERKKNHKLICICIN